MPLRKRLYIAYKKTQLVRHLHQQTFNRGWTSTSFNRNTVPSERDIVRANEIYVIL